MKILYGIQGTGNGHLARARALTPELRNLGIELDFVFSGREEQDFFNMDIFANDYRIFRGLSLVTERGRLNTFKTITQNNVFLCIKDALSLNLDGYDLIISDFEPVTAWAAKIRGKKSISISHQAAFDHDVPKVTGYLSARLLMHVFAPTSQSIGLHWHHFNQAILPPLIEPQRLKPSIKHKILVYMPFEKTEDITDFLQPFKDFQFWIYAKIEKPLDLGHIQIKPLSHKNFHKDLEDCNGVIGNAGFELASECIQLGKKMLVKPLLGQFEQLSNALALQTLHRATIINSLNKALLNDWLDLPSHKPVSYPNIAKRLATWIKAGDFDDMVSLTADLWVDNNGMNNYREDFGNQIIENLLV